MREAASPSNGRIVFERYDPSSDGPVTHTVNPDGINSIRVSDGGRLTRNTSNPGGEDIPGDYSPDGTRLVFFRVDSNDDAGLFVTDVDGTGLVDGSLVAYSRRSKDARRCQ